MLEILHIWAGRSAEKRIENELLGVRLPFSLACFRLLQFFDSFRQFGQARQPAKLFLEPREGSCRRSPNCLAAANGLPARDARLGTDDCIVLERAVRRDADLTANQDLRADGAAAGNTYLRGYDSISTDAHV